MHKVRIIYDMYAVITVWLQLTPGRCAVSAFRIGIKQNLFRHFPIEGHRGMLVPTLCIGLGGSMRPQQHRLGGETRFGEDTA